jgi:hypothetical protein
MIIELNSDSVIECAPINVDKGRLSANVIFALLERRFDWFSKNCIDCCFKHALVAASA